MGSARRAGLLVSLLICAVVAGAGCTAGPGRRGDQPPAVAPSLSLPPPVSAPATLGPGGIVPFVDEPASVAEFVEMPPPAPTPPTPRGPGCRAGQLTGGLTTWHRTSGGVYGWVVVTNVSDSPCTLHGAVGARLVATAGPVDIAYSDDITDAAARIVTGLDPGATGSLRLEWDGSFCAPVPGPLALTLALPHGGGLLTVPMADKRVPSCVRGLEAPTSSLRSDVFRPGDADQPVDTSPASPLQPLRISIVSKPRQARAGGVIRYIVALTNPTGAAVDLTGPIGFGQEISTGRGNPPQTLVFRLNRRVITSIPAHATVRYEMLLTVPATLTAGLTIGVNWLLYAPGLLDPNRDKDDPAPRNGFTLTIVK